MQDINIYQLLNFYAKKWYWIILLTVIGASLGFIYTTYIQVPLYKSDATLLVLSGEDRKVGQDSTLINNYIQLIKSRRVLEPVLAKQNYSISYEELVGLTTATNEKNTEVVKIAIASKDPKTSKELVDGVVASFRDEVKKLYNRNNISIVDNASTSTEPYNALTWKHTLIPALAGLGLSLIGLFFTYDIGLIKKKSSPKRQVKVTAAIAPKLKTTNNAKKSPTSKPSTKSAKVASSAKEVEVTPKKRATKTTKTAKTPLKTTTTKRKK